MNPPAGKGKFVGEGLVPALRVVAPLPTIPQGVKQPAAETTNSLAGHRRFAAAGFDTAAAARVPAAHTTQAALDSHPLNRYLFG